MADLVSATGAAARAADVLLRAAGGRSVLLRVPAPASAGDMAEELGLAAPEFQDLELAPVAFRKAGRWELLVSAAAVAELTGSQGYGAADVLFANAFGVLVDGVLLTVESVAERQLNGAPYVYRLVLRAPAAASV